MGLSDRVTEDVRILEVDLGVSDRVSRIEEDLALAVELDGVGRFVDTVSGLDQGQVGDSLGLDADVLLVHVFDVVDVVGGFEVNGARAQGDQALG